MTRALVVGCGYTGERLAGRLADRGLEVAGTTRTPGRARRLEEAGIRAIPLDLSERGASRRLEGEAPDLCFYLVPPLTRDRDPEEEDPELEAVLRALRRAPLEAFVYGSSTGVYGDREGEAVDESDLPAPDSPSGRARLAAERTLLRGGWRWDARPRIGRIGGIYGPGRTLRRAIREGRYHLVEGLDTWTNRIHVEDLVTGLIAIAERGENGRVYNLVDDEPHRSSAFARAVARTAGLELETLSLAEAEARYSASRLARKTASKRVSNRRLREELGVRLAYPTYREGIPAAITAEASPDAE